MDSLFVKNAKVGVSDDVKRKGKKLRYLRHDSGIFNIAMIE